MKIKPMIPWMFLFLVCSAVNVSAETPNTVLRKIIWADHQDIAEPFLIVANTSVIFRFDRPIARVAVSNPDICDVTTAGDSDLLINAKRPGTANLIVWDNKDNTLTYALNCTIDIDRLKTVLQGIDSEAEFQIQPFNNSIAVYGETETSTKLAQITEATKAFEKDALVYVNIREPKQILLEVRFAEVKRQYGKDRKVDFEFFSGYHSFSSFTGQTGATSDGTSDTSTFSPSNGIVGFELFPRGTQSVGNLMLSYFSGTTGIIPYIKWLEDKNLLKVIARPNLVSKDGEEAEFLVGGEFPVPTVTNNSVQVNYRPFGTALRFTPQILDDEVIRLKLETEVSELDFTNTITSGGTTVPTILKRAHKSTAELKENQTLVISGMITQKVNNIQRKVPILGDIPILETIFSSKSLSRTDVELVIIITPHIVKPFDSGEKKEFFNESMVKRSVRLFKPDFADVQGDTINKLFRQDEPLKRLENEEPQIRRAPVQSFANPPKEPHAATYYDAKNPFFNPAALDKPASQSRSQDTQMLAQPLPPLEGNKGYILKQ